MNSKAAREKGQVALVRLNTLLAREPKTIGHPEVTATVQCIIAYRNGLIDAKRQGECTQDELDRANALLSLAHGAEYPLVGFHYDRLKKARDEIMDMLEK